MQKEITWKNITWKTILPPDMNTAKEQRTKAQKIASYAIEGMLYEVTATPKPGLVDRDNSGAHHDMDYFTFMSSAAVLHNTFDEMTALGMEYSDRSVGELLSQLREAGKRAEEQMFLFTNGVNTHKGMIFSLGLLCGCAGYLLGQRPGQDLSGEEICLLAGEMCQGICDRDFSGLNQKKQLTKGEQMYRNYGYKGVRGVAESGYEIVRTVSLPVYTKLRSMDIPQNDALVHTLLYLIKNTEDTNIVSRHDRETALYAKEYAGIVLKEGGMLSEKGRHMTYQMDDDFIDRYISPGGCADLLAVTHFLYKINQM